MIRRMAMKSSLLTLVLAVGCDGGSSGSPGSGQHSPVSPETRNENFKKIAMELHNFHDTYKSFPPARPNSNGEKTSQLSWRVQLLPFLGQKELYERFRHDEPWDSDHNKSLLSEMPKEYNTLGKGTKTTIMAFMTVDDTQPRTGMTPTKTGETLVGSQLKEFRDGTSNTVMFVEAAPELAVPWTKPADLEYDVNKPIPKLGWPGDTSVLVALADTSVTTIPKDAKESDWRAIITRDGGEIANPQGMR